ncbi:MAG: hypothetical protein JO069_20250 [Verrucomicrobia bacterium]|nr:hypothetical protein [Verrucomicrobiota bacterium]
MSTFACVEAEKPALSIITPTDVRDRPGTVREIVGIAFQSDSLSVLGNWIIRPIEMLDRRFAGLGRMPGAPPLAIHAGIHVRMDDGREFVAEQLFGTPREDFVDGLNWTTLEHFHTRDHRGWDVTVPATCFRNIDQAAVEDAIRFLNQVTGRPFFGEDCTSFVERAFNKRRLFADSPSARFLGIGMRVGDPALPLLRPDAVLDPRPERLLRADTLRKLPDPTTEWDAPNWRAPIQAAFRASALVALISSGLWLLRRLATGLAASPES